MFRAYRRDSGLGFTLLAGGKLVAKHEDHAVEVQTAKYHCVFPMLMLAKIAKYWPVHHSLCIPFLTRFTTLLEEKGDAEAFDQVVDMFAGVFDALHDT